MTYKRRKRIEAVTFDDLVERWKTTNNDGDWVITHLNDDTFLLRHGDKSLKLSRDEVLIIHSPWHFSTMPKNIFDTLFEADF